jgi:hypothetical protein
MKTIFGCLVVTCVLVLGGSYAWVHRNHVAEAMAAPAVAPAPSTIPTDYEEAKAARGSAPIAGPLVEYMSHDKSSSVETLEPIPPVPSSQAAQSAHAIPHRVSASDHVAGDSPVGTSSAILHQTFGVAKAVSLAFEIPAHASNPQLRGTYHSFVKPADGASSNAEVEFLVLNERQYADCVSGHGGEAVFSAEDSDSQEVNAGLPPTMNKPAKYYLIFRNNSRAAGKKLVQADFRVDF